MFKRKLSWFFMLLIISPLLSATELSSYAQDNYFELVNYTDNDLQVKSTAKDGSSMDVVLPKEESRAMYPVDRTASITVKKLGKSPLHREHSVDLDKVKELYQQDNARAKRDGVVVFVMGKTLPVGVNFEYKFNLSQK
jgi:hypothetical protein